MDRLLAWKLIASTPNMRINAQSLQLVMWMIFNPKKFKMNSNWQCNSYILSNVYLKAAYLGYALRTRVDTNPESTGTWFWQTEPCVWLCSHQVWFGEDPYPSQWNLNLGVVFVFWAALLSQIEALALDVVYTSKVGSASQYFRVKGCMSDSWDPSIK